MTDDGYRLTAAVGSLLRVERQKAALTEIQLARRAGTTQQHLSRIEAGTLAPGLALLERLFDALDLQLRVGVEDRDADLDDGIARASGDDAVIAALGDLRALTRKVTGDLPFLLDGQIGAAVHGVPLKPRRVELMFAQDAVDLVAGWLATIPNVRRWNERYGDYDFIDSDPRVPGALRWWTPFDEVRVRLAETLPEPVRIVAGDRAYAVRPLRDIEADDPQIARIARRARALAA